MLLVVAPFSLFSQVFALFSLLVLLIDDFTETFATGANSSYANKSLFGPRLQTHSRSWKDYKKPSYLHRHKSHLPVTSLKCKLFIRLDLHQRPLTYSAFPFLLKIPSCNKQPSLPVALPLQVDAPFLYRYKSFSSILSSHLCLSWKVPLPLWH